MDRVNDNRTYDFDVKDWVFVTPPGRPIRITVLGYEKDGGFLGDPSDTLPGFAVDLDPTTVGPEFRTDVNDGAEFSYTVVWGVATSTTGH